jgi:hypothetical protein
LVIEGQTAKFKAVRETETDVLIYSQGANHIEERVDIAMKLWGAGIRAVYTYEEGASLDHLMTSCKRVGIPWIVIIRDRSLITAAAATSVKVKAVETKNEEVVPVVDLPAHILQLKHAKARGSGPSVTGPSAREKVSTKPMAAEPLTGGGKSEPVSNLDVEILGAKSDRSLESKTKRKVSFNCQAKIGT